MEITQSWRKAFHSVVSQVRAYIQNHEWFGPAVLEITRSQRLKKFKKGRYFCESHWTVMKTFSFIGQRSKYLHIKSLVIRTSGSWNNAFTKSRKVKNGRHFFENHWTVTIPFWFRAQAGNGSHTKFYQRFCRYRVLLNTYEWMNEWMNGWMDGWMDEWMDGWMVEWINW